MVFWRMGLGDRVFWSIDICIFVGLVWLKYGAPLFGLTWGLVLMLVVAGAIVKSNYIYAKVSHTKRSTRNKSSPVESFHVTPTDN